MNVKMLCLTAALVCVAQPSRAQDVAGDWSGRIGGSLGVIIHFNETTGGWDGTLEVPQQQVKRKLERLVVTPDQISFGLAEFGATYSARWNDADKAWAGTWTQGQAAPLVLKRADAAAIAAFMPRRPQEAAIAARSAGYTNSEVNFSNAAAGLTLAGTLSMPPGQSGRPRAAVVLVHGSGPHTRDENVLEHKVFAVLADHLARQGIAVLRYDKRGVGKSTGSYASATSYDFASDAEAALAFLRQRQDIDQQRIGLVGHSEGGLIVPLVASRDRAVRFVVILNGPGVRGAELMVEQYALAAQDAGVAPEQLARLRAFHTALLSAIAAEPEVDAARTRAAQVVDDAERQGTLPAGMSKTILAPLTSPWFHAFLRHQPVPVLQSLKQPVLVLSGELDHQVPAALDLPPIRAALAHNPRAIIRQLPRLNHLLQTATTGAVSEYIQIEETMSPLALDAVSEWILATTK